MCNWSAVGLQDGGTQAGEKQADNWLIVFLNHKNKSSYEIKEQLSYISAKELGSLILFSCSFCVE
jgi:hypothetical protein